MMLIGLAGQAGSGKSTVANYLTEVRDYREVSLDEPIRAGLQAMLGLSAADMTDRKAKGNRHSLARPLAAPAHADAGHRMGTSVCAWRSVAQTR